MPLLTQIGINSLTIEYFDSEQWFYGPSRVEVIDNPDYRKIFSTFRKRDGVDFEITRNTHIPNCYMVGLRIKIIGKIQYLTLGNAYYVWVEGDSVDEVEMSGKHCDLTVHRVTVKTIIAHNISSVCYDGNVRLLGSAKILTTNQFPPNTFKTQSLYLNVFNITRIPKKFKFDLKNLWIRAYVGLSVQFRFFDYGNVENLEIVRRNEVNLEGVFMPKLKKLVISNRYRLPTAPSLKKLILRGNSKSCMDDFYRIVEDVLTPDLNLHFCLGRNNTKMNIEEVIDYLINNRVSVVSKSANNV
jgi:hypothetical protein